MVLQADFILYPVSETSGEYTDGEEDEVGSEVSRMAQAGDGE